MSSVIEREGTRLLDGHRDRHAQKPLQPMVTGPITGDNSDQKGKMGPGYNDLRRKKKSSSAKWDKRRRDLSSISLNSQRLY